MKAHIGVDAEAGIVHSLLSTAANVDDMAELDEMLHDEESNAFGDAGYRDVDKREEAQGQQWHSALQLDERQQLSEVPGRPLSALSCCRGGVDSRVDLKFRL